MTRIAIPGAAGRMGRNLIDACRRSEGLSLGVATERSGHELIGSDAGVAAGLGELGVTIGDDLEAAVAAFDVLIDFTVPAAALAHLEICRRHGKRMVIGTTGFSDAQKQQIAAAARRDRRGVCAEHECRRESVFQAAGHGGAGAGR